MPSLQHILFFCLYSSALAVPISGSNVITRAHDSLSGGPLYPIELPGAQTLPSSHLRLARSRNAISPAGTAKAGVGSTGEDSKGDGLFLLWLQFQASLKNGDNVKAAKYLSRIIVELKKLPKSELVSKLIATVEQYLMKLGASIVDAQPDKSDM
ncbi:hypothetical protein NQ176_g9465 [Zarea fungicola]|uniref:Uncharacterized protein n=1 Tax=Zarea fungicola TaxID=93591 RepID=A0ACC1MME5_9HYPO|nr:hypothetical protein NQ176_g9465 [Lecanicillium fungicola]